MTAQTGLNAERSEPAIPGRSAALAGSDPAIPGRSAAWAGSDPPG